MNWKAFLEVFLLEFATGVGQAESNVPGISGVVAKVGSSALSSALQAGLTPPAAPAPAPTAPSAS